MEFEEELFYLYEAEAENSRKDFITEHGYTSIFEMTRSDKSFYEINRANTTKGALRRFYDRLNCGGYAFEIDTRLSPPKNNCLNEYISGILNNFSFVRLLGNTSLLNDEYLVFYRFAKNFGHHFIKVNHDGLITEKNGYGVPRIFDGWNSHYVESPEVVFAVKKDHIHHCSSTLNLDNGLNFGDTVSKTISLRTNAFSYHSQNYCLKKNPYGEIVIVDSNSTIVASVIEDTNNSAIKIVTGKEDYIENLSGRIQPFIKNGKLVNINEFFGKSKQHEEL